MKSPVSSFTQFAKQIARAAGHPWAFGSAIAIVVAWALAGSVFRYSDTWQLVINTGTTIVTFLMVFLIQNTQNRDSEAMHIKLDEIIRAIEGAQNALIDLEELSDEDLQRAHDHYKDLAERARERLKNNQGES